MRIRLSPRRRSTEGRRRLSRGSEVTDFATAADHGDANACAGTENQDRGVLERLEHLCGLRSLPAIGSNDEGRVGLLLGDRLRFRFDLIRDLDEAEAKFGRPFSTRRCSSVARLLRVFSWIMASMSIEWARGRFGSASSIFVHVEQAELHLGLHEDGLNQKSEVRRG